VLRELRKRELFTAPEDLVFCSPTGDHLNDDAFRDRFYDALKAAGLGDKRQGDHPVVFHDLRHTFGTLAVEACLYMTFRHTWGTQTFRPR
jgi:integrase